MPQIIRTKLQCNVYVNDLPFTIKDFLQNIASSTVKIHNCLTNVEKILHAKCKYTKQKRKPYILFCLILSNFIFLQPILSQIKISFLGYNLHFDSFLKLSCASHYKPFNKLEDREKTTSIQ